ncbi:hypothetical protein PFISCL1PPCAC_26416, partial [Pristionchus fissidentatus]
TPNSARSVDHENTTPSSSSAAITPTTPSDQPMKRGSGRPRQHHLVVVSTAADSTMAAEKESPMQNRGNEDAHLEDLSSVKVEIPDQIEEESVPAVVSPAVTEPALEAGRLPPPPCYNTTCKLLVRACPLCLAWMNQEFLTFKLERLEERRKSDESNPAGNNKPPCYHDCIKKMYMDKMDCKVCSEYLDKKTLARAYAKIQRQQREEENGQVAPATIEGRPECYYDCAKRTYKEGGDWCK